MAPHIPGGSGPPAEPWPPLEHPAHPAPVRGLEGLRPARRVVQAMAGVSLDVAADEVRPGRGCVASVPTTSPAKWIESDTLCSLNLVRAE